MKKKYSKPGIIIENFTIAQNIAANCGAAHKSPWGSPTHADKGHCGWFDGVDTIWAAEPACTEDGLTTDDDVKGVCYNNPSLGMNIFNS